MSRNRPDRPVARRKDNPPTRRKDNPPTRRNDATGRIAERRSSDLGGEQVEGRQAVRELLRADRRPVREVLVERDRDASDVLEEICDLADERGVALRMVTKDELSGRARTEVPQGVVALAGPLRQWTLDELAVSTRSTPCFLIVFDGISDPHNLGTMLRSALAAGATGAVLGSHRSASITPTVTKAAAGAIEHLPIALVPGVPAALRELQRQHVWTVGLEADGDVMLEQTRALSEPVALIVGAEGRGLSALAEARCDVSARIPLYGPIESLNVAAATAVVLFTVARHREASTET